MSEGKIKKIIAFITIFTMILSNSIFVFADQYSDIQNHWAEKYIQKWIEKQSINGYPDGTFRPNKNISRAEFMALINKSFGYTKGSKINYSDVSSDSWYANVVAIAKGAGYIGGYPDGTIRPNAPITRQEAALVIMKIKKLIEGENGTENFKDINDIAPWAKEAVGAVAKAKIMAGYPDETFRPTAPIKRAEAVVALDKALILANETQTIVYDKAGTYGPETGQQNVEGSVVIKAKDVVLKNTIINGNLTIEKEVEDGDVTLENVEVRGTTDILGGGQNSIFIKDCDLGEVTVDKKDGKIRILASGNTVIKKIIAESGAKFEEKDLKDDGFKEVLIRASEDEKVVLKGNFKNVIVKSKDIELEVVKGSEIEILTLDGAVEVTGEGTIETANINADGVSFEKSPENKNIKDGVQKPSIGSSTSKSSGGSSSSNSNNDDDNDDTNSENSALDNLYVQEYIVFLNESTKNRITVESSEKLASTAELFKKEESGEWTSLGFLFDDGSLSDHGDEIKSDRVYSNIFEFKESKTGQLNLKIIGKTEAGKEYTKEFSIEVMENSHGEDVEEAVQTLNKVEQSLEEELQNETEVTTKEVLDKIENIVEQEEEVENVTRNENTVEVQYKTGITSVITIEEEGQNNRSIGTNSTSDIQTTSTVASTGNHEIIGSNSALIWAPFAKEFGSYDESSELEEILSTSSLAFDVEVVKNTNADIDTLKDMTDYGLIVLATHGSNGKWIGTGELITDSNKAKYEAQQKLGQIAIWKKLKIKKAGGIIPTEPVYAVNNKWFEKNLKGEFPNSIIINNSCESTKTDALWNLFKDKGAGAYLGYNKVVSSKFAVDQVVEYVTGIAKDMKNSGDAYIRKVDTEYNNCTWEMRGKQNLIFSDKGLKNGGFETGLTAWNPDGDGRVINALGDIMPTEGNKMGIISTGLGYTTSQGAISQTFVVPEDATELSFDWNYLSEEFLEYINDGYDDPFKVTLMSGEEETQVVYLTVYGIAQEFGASDTDDYWKDETVTGTVYGTDNETVTGTVYGTDDKTDNTETDEKNPGDQGEHAEHAGNLIHVSPKIVFDRGDVWMTDWQNRKFDIRKFRDKKVTIKFIAVDVKDTIFDTAVLLDNITIKSD